MANSKRKCKQCKIYYSREQIVKLNAGNFCHESTGRKCIVNYALDKGNQAKAKKTIQRDLNRDIRKKKKEHREAKKKVRKISHDLDLTQKSFNKMRVLEEKLWFKRRGQEPECISCGRTNMDWCCGHYKTRGSQSNLRFDRNNTFLQCNWHCNKNLSGNISGDKNTRGYKQGLKERFGLEKAKEIMDYCETNTKPRKWNKDELTEMRKNLILKLEDWRVS